MTDKNYSNFTTTRPNKGFYDPYQPENHREEREDRKGARAREKRLASQATVFSFYIMDPEFRDDFHMGLKMSEKYDEKAIGLNRFWLRL